MGRIAELLSVWVGGDPRTIDYLAPLVYLQLQRLAAGKPADLLRQTYRRLALHTFPGVNQAAVYVSAAHMVRRVLVENSEGHGSRPLLALDQALHRLGALDPRKAQAVELRYFGGLDLEETADTLQVSLPTLKQDLLVAEAFLGREMRRPNPSPEKKPPSAENL